MKMHIRFTTGIARKGLLFSLLLAGAGIQGCNMGESAPSAPGAGTDQGVREDKSGADIPAAPQQGGSGASEIAPAARTSSLAPECIILSSWTSWGMRYARATNTCRTTQHFRLIWAFAIDGSCTEVAPGNFHQEKRGVQAYVSEIRGC
jgi:hypothetical protein